MDHWNWDDEPTTRAEFEAAVDALACTAYANGVKVENGISLRHSDDTIPDWDVEITRLGKTGVTD